MQISQLYIEKNMHSHKITILLPSKPNTFLMAENADLRSELFTHCVVKMVREGLSGRPNFLFRFTYPSSETPVVEVLTL